VSQSTIVVSLPSETVRTAVGALPDGAEPVLWAMDGPPPAPRIDLVVAPYLAKPGQVLAHLEGVETALVQSQSIGYDGVAEALPPGHVFANASSVHETATAELTLALILAARRGIPGFVRDAGLGRWAPALYPGLADCTVLLVGIGGVGRAIEARLAPFETTVLRVASRARTDEKGVVHGLDELATLLPAADVVVLAVPLTDATTHLVDERFLSSMRDGALLVNIARGAVVDTDALLRHTASGRLSAALDVTDPEPLPGGHPLLALPNVLVTPHVGGLSAAMMPRMGRLVRVQVDRLLEGREPLNVVLRS
jgi:phosphoglycerate dehydrogenase-like enzyme